MSEQSKSALDAAIAAHVADESGSSMVTGYVLCVAHQGIEDMDAGRTRYLGGFADNQAYHSALGLAGYLIDEILPTTFGVED
ncbi:hypothetical protein ACSHWG_00765 [Leucobacter sp. Z1108]|uniref:hypothetical protein n=1 Tax=Leucobacter sp. Z1108 TaxID=3439066 RepID=UPI003F35D711